MNLAHFSHKVQSQVQRPLHWVQARTHSTTSKRSLNYKEDAQHLPGYSSWSTNYSSRRGNPGLMACLLLLSLVFTPGARAPRMTSLTLQYQHGESTLMSLVYKVPPEGCASSLANHVARGKRGQASNRRQLFSREGRSGWGTIEWYRVYLA